MPSGVTLPASIIIPVYNEARLVESALQRLQPLRQQGFEVIVVDGGSTDQTAALAKPLVDHLVHSEPGRGRQMNGGAAIASAELLYFLHIDTCLPAQFSDCVIGFAQSPKHWGFFNIRLEASDWRLRIVERMMCWRSRSTGIGTGDQLLHIRADDFKAMGGFAEIALMEDVEFCKRAKKQWGRPRVEAALVSTSARRWQQHGVWRTVLLMWQLRLAYWLGVSADKLALRYRAAG